METIANNSSLVLPYSPGDTIQEQSDTNYLKKALDQDNYDTEIYSDGTLYWHNIYLGFDEEGVRKVAKFQITALEPFLYLKQYRQMDKFIIFGTLIVCTIAFLVLLYLSSLIYRRIRFFFATVSLALTKVISGDTSIQISEMDEEVQAVAQSFNQLVNELQVKDEQLREAEKKGIYAFLFKRAVGFLKNKEHADADQ